MSTVQQIRKPTKKHLINFVLFLLSIVFISFFLPHTVNNRPNEIIGGFVVVASCYLILFLFISHFRPEILEVTRKTFFIIITIFFFISVTSLVVAYGYSKALFIIPFAIIPLMIHTFYDARLALFILLTTIMLAGFLVPEPFEFVFMNFITGVVTIFSLTNIYRKGKIFFSAFLVVLSYSVIYFGLMISRSDNIADINWSDLRLFVVNGMLVLLTYPLIFLFEKKFYFLSNTTLLELSDTNQPLLRKFAGEAPGSFQHSRQVSILAEEAAREVGANFLLARAGALYHDIGKIVNSEYFIENQSATISPHEELNPLDSSKLIIDHVNQGVIIARKYKLPVQIMDFIRTHHGTTKAYYFYKKYLEEINNEVDSMKDFEYSGPKPFSKEQAIVMMADAVEASSRTLEKHTEESIDQLVERILYIQEQDNQFSDAPLTFKDISDIKRIFKKNLTNVYHKRTSYPGISIS